MKGFIVVFKSWWRSRIVSLAYLSLLALCLGYLGQWYWFAELFSHFVPYYAVIVSLAAWYAIHRYQRYWFAVWAMMLCYWLVQPMSRWQTAPSPMSQHSLVWYNAHLSNHQQHQDIAHLIHSRQPEMIALAEIGHKSNWQAWHSVYPHGCWHEENSPFSLALWSQTPLQQCHVAYQDDIPYIRAQLADGTMIYVLHPPPPINADLARIRLAYLQTVAQHIRQEQQVLAVGDLNTTPFSPIYRQLMQETQLQAALPYWTPTWLPFGLSIDHVLQRHLPTVHAQALPWGTSDHRALWVSW